MKMNYGAEGLGPESKKYFTRDAARQDYYCLSLPIVIPVPPDPLGCPVAVCRIGSQIYNFADAEERYKLIAYGGASYSRSLGGHNQDLHLSSTSGFVADADHDVDLQGTSYFYGKYVMWHGAQFRGMLAKQRPYWAQFLRNMGITAR